MKKCPSCSARVGNELLECPECGGRWNEQGGWLGDLLAPEEPVPGGKDHGSSSDSAPGFFKFVLGVVFLVIALLIYLFGLGPH
jgi:hypothetical protein